jgi:hypothetical protein
MDELRAMGYLFWIEGDSIVYSLSRSADRQEALPTERVKALFQVLKENRETTIQLIEIMNQQRSIEERHHYLEAVMGAIWDQAFQSVLSEQNFKPSHETRYWEDKAERLWKDVLRGHSTLVIFRQAVNEWKKAGRTAHQSGAGPSNDNAVYG